MEEILSPRLSGGCPLTMAAESYLVFTVIIPEADDQVRFGIENQVEHSVVCTHKPMVVGFDQKVWVLCRSLAADEDQVDGTFRIMAEGVSYDESAVHYVQMRVPGQAEASFPLSIPLKKSFSLHSVVNVISGILKLLQQR